MFPRRSLLALSLVALLAAPALAADGTRLTSMEKSKVRDAIGLLEQAWKDCLSMKIIDVMGSGGDNIPYEKIKKNGMDVDPTFQDAIDHLKNMLDKDNVQSAPLAGWGTVDVQPGIDNDKIQIRKGLLEDLCAAGTPAAKKMELKLQLVATLANELMHVFQKWTEQTTVADRPKLCDGEKDSDMASIKALEPILNALSNAMGMPHTTIGAIRTDPQYVLLLGLCMEDMGATSAADIAAVHRAAKDKLGSVSPRSGYKGRKDRFAYDLLPPFTNWATWYYGTSDAFAEALAETDELNRLGSEMTGDDTVTTRNYPAPPGTLMVGARGYFNELGQVMLANLVTNNAGQTIVEIRRDLDGDGLPELPLFAGRFVEDLPGTNFKPLYSTRIHPTWPGIFWFETPGLMFHDTVTGRILALPTMPDGQPIPGPAVPLVQHPALANPDLYMIEMITPSTSQPIVRLVFMDPSEGAPNAIWFDIEPDLSVTPFVSPGQTRAQALWPTNEPGIDELFVSPGGGPIRLMGNPESFVEFASIGRGSRQTLGVNLIDLEGITPFFNVADPIRGNDLYQFFKPGNIPFEGFLSRVGRNIDCTVNDETGDGSLDRLHLSTDPPRLHFLLADSAAPGTWSHQYEIALELQEYVGFKGWNNADGRNILVPEELDGFIKTEILPLHLYAQRLLDLDGDGAENDTGIIVRRTIDSFFDIFFIFDAPGGALITDTHALPPEFEPGDIVWGDINGDVLPDLLITDYNTGDQRCFQNISTPGNVRFMPCAVVPPCCPGNADKVPGQVNFADITAVLANFNMPANPNGTSIGDANCDGLINFGDVTSVLANFLNPCP